MGAPFLLPLDQQVIVITGASSGIGLCTARLAAARGARVVLVARSGDVIFGLSAEIDAAGGRSIAVPADVASREQLEAAALAAIQAFGRIDTWVNNAGVSIHGRLDAVSEEDNRRLFATNFWGVVNGSLVAVPHLERRGGALINVGSAASASALPLQGMYACSKLAVRSFTDTLRVEVQEIDRRPVSVTLIQPSAVGTPHAEHAAKYHGIDAPPAGALLDPAEVAEAILGAATQSVHSVEVGALPIPAEIPARWLLSPAPHAAAGQQARASAGALHHPSKSGRTHSHGPI